MPAGALAGHLAAFALAGWIGWSLGSNRAQARWIALATLLALGIQLTALANPERFANALPSPAWIWVSDFSPQLACLLLACALRAGAGSSSPAAEAGEGEGTSETLADPGTEPGADPPTEEPAPGGRGAQIRRGILGGALVGLALYASPLPWREPPPLASSSWLDTNDPSHPVVRQSADASCAAAAAATLLRARRIAPLASEAYLAELCWTDPVNGTGALALWRGLSLAAGDARKVRYTWPSFEELPARGPCLIRVGLSDQVSDPELRRVLEEECGWPPGEAHAVVFYGFDAGRAGEESQVALIGDPRLGFERWGLTHFRALWQGVALEVGP